MKEDGDDDSSDDSSDDDHSDDSSDGEYVSGDDTESCASTPAHKKGSPAHSNTGGHNKHNNDGHERQVPKVGDVVRAQHEHDGEWTDEYYPGVITDKNKNGTFVVMHDDGGTSVTVAVVVVVVVALVAVVR